MENRLYDVLTAELIAVNANCAKLFEGSSYADDYGELLDSGILLELSQHMHGATCAFNALLLGGASTSGIAKKFRSGLLQIDSPPAE